MSGFNAKHIFLEEMVEIGQNAVLKLKWSKKSFLQRVSFHEIDLMEERVVFHKWI